MPMIEIKHHETGRTIYAGNFPSIVECLENAVDRRENMSGADLRRQNISNANLDGICLRGSKLLGANLTGANLSEADLEHCDLRETLLCNTCLCETNLSGCDFSGALFGATDISFASLPGAVFSTSSALEMDFSSVKDMKDCRFVNPDGTPLSFNTPPLVLKGLLHTPVIILGTALKIGQYAWPLEKILPLFHALIKDFKQSPKEQSAADFFTFLDNHRYIK